MVWYHGIFVNWLYHMSLTVQMEKPGKYGSKTYVGSLANLWNSPMGEEAAWLKNSPTAESFN